MAYRQFSVLLLFLLLVSLVAFFFKLQTSHWDETKISESTQEKILPIEYFDGSKPVVNIPSLGKVVGSFSLSSEGRNYSAFLGIPYAMPPIRERRFKDPDPVEPWEVLDATKFGPMCSSSSENCLTLNIFTHDANPVEKKPVLVFIHGGAFVAGGSRIYSPNFFLDRDVVLITINYRLGPFGFLSTGDAEAPGNYGLLDQSLALRWIRDYIDHFGGDSKLVTITGHSAGGASVEYQILSPRSKGLFDRAIAQSGSSLSNWAFSKESSLDNTKRLAKNLNCTQSTSKEIINCLRGKSSSEILTSANKNPSRIFGGFPIGSWLPRVDIERESPFLPAEPEKMIRDKQFNPVPLITGIAAHEGLGWGKHISGSKMEEFKQNPVEYIPSMCGFQFRSDKKNLAKMIYQYYFSDNKSIKDEVALEEMLSDCNFNKGGEDSTRFFSQYNKNPTFHYLFAEKEGNHNSIIQFIFGTSHLNNEKDRKISHMILDFWVSFASKGVPHSDSLVSKWSPVKASSSDGVKGYLKVEAGNAEMIKDSMPFDRRLKFLNKIFDYHD